MPTPEQEARQRVVEEVKQGLEDGKTLSEVREELLENVGTDTDEMLREAGYGKLADLEIDGSNMSDEFLEDLKTDLEDLRNRPIEFPNLPGTTQEI